MAPTSNEFVRSEAEEPPTATRPEALRRAMHALASGERENADAWMRLADRLPG